MTFHDTAKVRIHSPHAAVSSVTLTAYPISLYFSVILTKEDRKIVHVSSLPSGSIWPKGPCS